MADQVFNSAARLARLYEQRQTALTAALKRGMTRALLAVEGQASKNLSGSGGPGAYPIPVRQQVRTVAGTKRLTPGGNLRRSLSVRRLTDTSGEVRNTAIYARAVHTLGFHAYGNPAAPFYRPRPFLTDAVDTVQPTDIVQAELRKAVLG